MQLHYFCIWRSSLLKNHLLKFFSLQIEATWCTGQKLVFCLYMNAFLGFSFDFIGIRLFLFSTALLFIVDSWHDFKSVIIMPPILFFLSLSIPRYLHCYCGSIKLSEFFPLSIKSANGVFIALNLYVLWVLQTFNRIK